MKKINVAVWGLGPHAVKNILPALKLSQATSLYGICSRNSDTIAKCSSEFGCLSWNNPKQMLEDSNLDVIYLSTPTGLHASQGREVLLANKHLWCEKPFADNLENVAMLVDLSRERNLTLAEGFMYLYHPQFIQLKRIFESGKLGKISQIICNFGIPPLERSSFRNNVSLGGGALLDVGSYLVSAMVSLFSVANPQVIFTEIMMSPESQVDTDGISVLRYPNGTRAILRWGTHRSYRNEIDFWGEKGSVYTQYIFSKSADYVPKFRFLDRHGIESQEEGRSANHFLEMMSVFCRLVGSSADAEREREAITRRAQLIDKIKKTKIKGEAYGEMERCCTG